jgi:ribosomal protein S14
MFSYIGKSVFKRFKLNRHAAKYNASLGFLVGLRKSSF